MNKKPGRQKKTYADGTPKIKGIKKDGSKKEKKGRKKITFDKHQKDLIKNLYSMQCTDLDVALKLGVSESKILSWLNESESHMNLKREGLSMGCVSLRQAMFKNAIQKNNTQMQIHLSKNYLGMGDNAKQEEIVTEELKQTKTMRELALEKLGEL